MIAVGAIIWRLLRRAARPRVATLLVTLLSFWIFAGLARAYVTFGPLTLAGTGDESRYLYVGAVFTILLASELLRGWRPSLWAGAVAALLVAAAIVSNIGPLRDGSRLLQTEANYTAAALETVDLERPVISPEFVSNGFIFLHVTAREWFSAKRDLGSPFADQQLSSLPDYARQQCRRPADQCSTTGADRDRVGRTARAALGRRASRRPSVESPLRTAPARCSGLRSTPPPARRISFNSSCRAAACWSRPEAQR